MNRYALNAITGMVCVWLFSGVQSLDAQVKDDGKLNIICFGAHPDDAEYKSGGVAALWAKAGHRVKLVSVTNGDIGHWAMAGGPLAKRRTAESGLVAKRLGVTSEVLDIHDGELEPTLENRKKITRLIREWNADIVISHRPWDYHPDHRYVGVLVQDAAYMVQVPHFCPDSPPLKSNPLFLYSSDRFRKPYPRCVFAISQATGKYHRARVMQAATVSMLQKHRLERPRIYRYFHRSSVRPS